MSAAGSPSYDGFVCVDAGRSSFGFIVFRVRRHELPEHVMSMWGFDANDDGRDEARRAMTRFIARCQADDAQQVARVLRRGLRAVA